MEEYFPNEIMQKGYETEVKEKLVVLTRASLSSPWTHLSWTASFVAQPRQEYCVESAILPQCIYFHSFIYECGPQDYVLFLQCTKIGWWGRPGNEIVK